MERQKPLGRISPLLIILITILVTTILFGAAAVWSGSPPAVAVAGFTAQVGAQTGYNTYGAKLQIPFSAPKMLDAYVNIERPANKVSSLGSSTSFTFLQSGFTFKMSECLYDSQENCLLGYGTMSGGSLPFEIAVAPAKINSGGIVDVNIVPPARNWHMGDVPLRLGNAAWKNGGLSIDAEVLVEGIPEIELLLRNGATVARGPKAPATFYLNGYPAIVTSFEHIDGKLYASGYYTEKGIKKTFSKRLLTRSKGLMGLKLPNLNKIAKESALRSMLAMEKLRKTREKRAAATRHSPPPRAGLLSYNGGMDFLTGASQPDQAPVYQGAGTITLDAVAKENFKTYPAKSVFPFQDPDGDEIFSFTTKMPYSACDSICQGYITGLPEPIRQVSVTGAAIISKKSGYNVRDDKDMAAAEGYQLLACNGAPNPLGGSQEETLQSLPPDPPGGKGARLTAATKCSDCGKTNCIAAKCSTCRKHLTNCKACADCGKRHCTASKCSTCGKHLTNCKTCADCGKRHCSASKCSTCGKHLTNCKTCADCGNCRRTTTKSSSLC
jgi:hypothetical protein